MDGLVRMGRIQYNKGNNKGREKLEENIDYQYWRGIELEEPSCTGRKSISKK